MRGMGVGGGRIREGGGRREWGKGERVRTRVWEKSGRERSKVVRGLLWYSNNSKRTTHSTMEMNFNNKQNKCI